MLFLRQHHGERGAGSCQGEGGGVGGEVKGQGSLCPTDVPGVRQEPGDTLTVLPRFRRPVSPCTALELCRERGEGLEGGRPAMPVGSPARPWCHTPARGADPQVQAEAPSRCDIMGRASSSQVTKHGWPALSCLPRTMHRAQSSPCLATLLPHGLDCRSGQKPRLPALGTLGHGSALCYPTLQGEHSPLSLPLCSLLARSRSIPSRTRCRNAAQTLAQLFGRIKSTWESASPAL